MQTPSPFFTTLDCTNGDLRLANGQTSSEGRLEICINGVWGTVCDDYWGRDDAQVACAQLGYTRTGEGGGSIFGWLAHSSDTHEQVRGVVLYLGGLRTAWLHTNR